MLPHAPDWAVTHVATHQSPISCHRCRGLRHLGARHPLFCLAGNRAHRASQGVTATAHDLGMARTKFDPTVVRPSCSRQPGQPGADQITVPFTQISNICDQLNWD